jgi:hypothetical protein
MALVIPMNPATDLEYPRQAHKTRPRNRRKWPGCSRDSPNLSFRIASSWEIPHSRQSKQAKSDEKKGGAQTAPRIAGAPTGETRPTYRGPLPYLFQFPLNAD